MVGIDMVLVSRVSKALENQAFYDKILNEVEKEYIFTKRRANKDVEAKSVSGLYAAKEAVLKAFGVGITNGYGLKDVTIDHTELGAPIVVLSDKLKKLMKKNKKNDINLSISHDGEYAIAIAVFS